MTYFPHADISTTLAMSGREAGVRVPGVVLFAGRERPIFISTGRPRQQRRSLAFFANSPLRRAAGNAMLAMFSFTRRGLPRAQLTLPMAWRRFGGELSDVAMYCGSPGPLQKVTLYMPPSQPDALPLVVKISLRATADHVIEHEAAVLDSLDAAPAALTAHLPRLVMHGRLDSGRCFLATHAGIGAVAPSTLGMAHVRFLRALGQATRADHPWRSGPAMARTTAALRALSGRAIAADDEAALLDALETVGRVLGEHPVPHVLTHGDFTRFNIRQHGGRFVVFDWEYAQGEGNPIADLLHYHLSQPGNWSALTVMHHALAQAEQFADSSYSDWKPGAQMVAALALHALIDTLVFYAAAGGELDLGSFLVQRYLGLVKGAGAWGAR